MGRGPALAASALLHLGLLAAFVAWPDQAEPPPPPPVPVKLVPPPPDGPAEVSAAPEPSPEPPAAEPVLEPSPEPPLAAPPPAPAPPAPAPRRPAPPQPRPPEPRIPPPVQRPTPPPRQAAPRPAPTPAPRAAPPRPAPTPPRASPPRPAPTRPAPQPAEAPLDLSALGQRLARSQPARPAKPAGATPGQLAAARAELGQRLQRLWRPNCGPDGALAVNVRVRFRLADGRIQGAPELVGGASEDGVVRAAQERALAAVRSAAPYDWLPEELQNGDFQPSFNADQACG